MTALTEHQRLMLLVSAADASFGTGAGVELRGAANWRTARRLVALDLGWIQGGRPQGSELPGLFFANADGIEMVAEPEGDDD